MKIFKLIPAVLALLVLISIAGLSHHYVLVPEKFVYQKGDTLNVYLMVGEVFAYEFERELQDSMTPRFELITQTGTQNILAMMPDGADPVATVPVNFDGPGLVVMQRRPSMITETPGAFQRYLAEEHVTGITFDSTKTKKTGIREKYSRCIKTLVTTNRSARDDFFTKPVGLKLELLILKNPFRLMPDEEMPVQLLLDGKPLKGGSIEVFMQSYGSKISRLVLQTDKMGMTSFKPALDATCVITSVYMKKLPKKADADYESTWASYSFKVMNGGE
jgi:hypothetical protein